MTSAELRRRFLDFFIQRKHQAVPSSSLVPGNDPTLLFTNAGMVQFKDVFLGQDDRPYRRATTAQRCVRAGGKHNDLENVGYTARHHTFFEMLGNFSFGDYFKREAIRYAWEFLTVDLGLPPEKLWVTVYESDGEAADIWLKEIGVDPKRFTRIGDKPGGRPYESDNFWTMGDTGPCGPCTEIFYDHGPEVAGGPPGSPEEDGDRYIEIWNLVFMQYDRDREGVMTPLPKPSVDTGMGLERLAAVIQGVHSNYEIDLFRHLMQAVADLAGLEALDNPSLRVIADHIRSCSFLIADGVLPANEGRGYVLRRIIRRAARHGHRLGLRDPFFHRLVAPLVDEMGEAYPELAAAQNRIEQVLAQEEERFAETLEKGLRLLEDAVVDLDGGTLSGELIFRLYDTYGFPVDLTADIAREQSFSLDMAGFEKAMAAQRAQSRDASRFDVDYSKTAKIDAKTEFSGYERVEDQGRVVALLREGEPVERLAAGEAGGVVLDNSPFYAESGGQVGDSGALRAAGVVFEVDDTRKLGAAHLHVGRLCNGELRVGDQLEARVDAARRQAIILNHSATHLMHEALRRILGDHVEQKGSLVTPERLRFDFAHFAPVSAEELREVERLVNAQIRENRDASAEVMALDEARKTGAKALFGEKYGDRVRVLRIGFSTELCGGTHVRRVGDIGVFKIVSESGVAAGIRRIEAITGEVALRHLDALDARLDQIATLLKTGREGVDDKLRQLIERQRTLEKSLDEARRSLASQAGADLAGQARNIDGISVLAARLDGMDTKELRETLDRLKDQLGHAAIVLAAVGEGDKITLVAGVTQGETARIRAGDLVNSVAGQVGGKGGGRPDMAQAGGNDPSQLDQALASVPAWVESQLKPVTS
ncbi:alanine--tRNA ligase [Acidihalobacter yilgarnensis]|uniref:Alanine--tRNA ligase n=1 Tax=Acidihalobacter yilgarnensis TaxID=2819280 RepID=A0A1D8ITB7_9GAMM|nr:alanine--tRNA ligase [Acidihalobacter yilgarnensis]AOU99731.1 alanine--tRNA ligase [Acidihalobacter yilgarnensis]